MLILILLLMAGSFLAYISQFNMTLVSVNLGAYVFSNIPLFYVITGSLVLGLVLSFIMHSFRDISTSWTLRGKKNEIKKNRDEVLELTKRIHQLELENEKLKHAKHNEPEDRNAL
jgi:putative membrane protein